MDDTKRLLKLTRSLVKVAWDSLSNGDLPLCEYKNVADLIDLLLATAGGTLRQEKEEQDNEAVFHELRREAEGRSMLYKGPAR